MISSHLRQPIAPKTPRWILSDLNRYLHKKSLLYVSFNGAIYEIRTHDSALARRRVATTLILHMAEDLGFEPRELTLAGFQDRCNKPDSANPPYGVPSEIRTPDPLIKSQMLYRLS